MYLLLNFERLSQTPVDQLELINRHPVVVRTRPYIHRDEEQDSYVLMFSTEPSAEELTLLKLLFSDLVL